MATLGYGDAIGNEALGIRQVLHDHGYDSRIYVDTSHRKVKDETEDYRNLLKDSHADNILIHHFSIASRASRLAFTLPDRMILIYHNITPPEYFIGTNKTLVKLCWVGRRELTAYRARCDLALGDSAFNRKELDRLGFPRTGVLPVVPSFTHLDGLPNAMLANRFDDGCTNILFVGRTIPNKRLEDIIRFFQVYRLRYDRSARLLLVGAQDGFRDYVALLHHLVSTYRINGVHLIGHVTNEELTALYNVADLFLSASEHEGFCVPIVEAFYKRIPVIAFAAAAVPDTMDGGGILYDRKDPRHIASLMHAVLSDDALREQILDTQDVALQRLRQRDFGATLMRFVKQVQASPQFPRPSVTSDFQRQFELAEHLAEIRPRRPSAYLALPKENEATR